MKMEILSFEGSNGSSKRKRSNKFVAIATIVALGFMGSTFAASISLNGGADVQYGQGVSSAVACNSDILVTPTNTFDGTAFNLETITVLDTTTVTTSAVAGLGNCIGKKILIKALNNSNVSQWSCEVSLNSFSSGIVVTQNASLCPTTSFAVAGTGNNKGFSIRNTGTAIAAANIYKITLESKN
jgi:hypothetical protein